MVSLRHSRELSFVILITLISFPFLPITSCASNMSIQATEIVPGLYMSDLYVAEHPATYTALGITHVLSVMPGSVQFPKCATPQVLQVPIRDQPFEELAGHLGKTTAFINDALVRRGSVLVHCVQGMSRSASVVSAYLIATYGWSVKEAVEYVRSKSTNAFPNTGFVHQLQEYRDTLRR